jgi:hypothetical protein
VALSENVKYSSLVIVNDSLILFDHREYTVMSSSGDITPVEIEGFAMGSSDWFELETLNGEIAHSQTRLVAARKTQNHGLVKLLQREIAEAEKWRSRLLGHITTRLGSPDPAPEADPAAPWDVQVDKLEEVQAEPVEAEQPGSEAAAEAPETDPETDVVLPDPAPRADTIEGENAVWDQLSRTDIERLKRELGSRRAEILARHAEELKDLEADQVEIDAFELAIDAFARKFKVAGSEVVVPFEGDRGSRGLARG